MVIPEARGVTLRVVQAGFHADAHRRGAEALLHAWPTLQDVAIAAAHSGVDVTVVQRAHADETVNRGAVTFHFVDDASRASTRMLERIRSLEPDVVHVQGLSSPRAVRQLERAVPDARLMAQDHGSVVPTGARAIAWRWAHHPLAGVTFTSREQAVPWKRAKILHSDLPVYEVLESSSHFLPGDRAEARAKTQMSGSPCFLWTGRLDANKDPLLVLAAFARVAERLPDARLWCCYGDAPLLAQVRACVAASPVLTERVVLLGTRPHAELELRFRATDFFVQASHREGSGYSIIEALACGATPLVTDIPAARAIVAGAGSLTPVDDVSTFADALVEWGQRDVALLRVAARARFDDALSFEVVGRQLRAAYDALATAPRAQQP